jgi:NADPH-dependent curcumin reductase
MDDGPFNHRPYMPPVMQEGGKVFAGAICEVIETYRTPGYAVGEIISYYAGWADYALIDPTDNGIPLIKLPTSIKPEDYICLDLTGQSAYFGFFKRAEASNKMKTVVVNAAAGGIGSMVTQFAKNIIGVEKVIGVCGSDEKCRIIKEQCGVDIALNYKSPNFEADFVAATPDYIDL